MPPFDREKVVELDVEPECRPRQVHLTRIPSVSAQPRVETVAARTHGRYLVVPPAVTGPAPLLVGFHGYGEHAERHLRELRRIPGCADWLIVSVEALHRFYSASRDHVVGSWMTRQDRELAIADNLAYVRSVVREVQDRCAVDGTLVYAGFSQGVAMAYRAATRGGHRCHGIIAVAGDVPPELRDDALIAWPPVFVGRGQTDGWYTQAKMDADLAFLTGTGTEVDSLVFDGGHEWTDALRDAAGRFLARRRGAPV